MEFRRPFLEIGILCSRIIHLFRVWKPISRREIQFQISLMLEFVLLFYLDSRRPLIIARFCNENCAFLLCFYPIFNNFGQAESLRFDYFKLCCHCSVKVVLSKKEKLRGSVSCLYRFISRHSRSPSY